MSQAKAHIVVQQEKQILCFGNIPKQFGDYFHPYIVTFALLYVNTEKERYKGHLVFMTEIPCMTVLYRKVSVVSDYLWNMTSDHKTLHEQSDSLGVPPEYRTTVKYTCTFCVSFEAPLV